MARGQLAIQLWKHYHQSS